MNLYNFIKCTELKFSIRVFRLSREKMAQSIVRYLLAISYFPEQTKFTTVLFFDVD